MSEKAASGPHTEPKLWLERTATRELVARNSKGAEVAVGIGPGRFSPGELFQLALAGCQAMSIDRGVARILGTADYDLTVIPEADYSQSEDRYTRILVRMLANLASLSEAEVAELETAAQCDLDSTCTVGHTLAAEMPFACSFENAEDHRVGEPAAQGASQGGDTSQGAPFGVVPRPLESFGIASAAATGTGPTATSAATDADATTAPTSVAPEKDPQ